MFKLNTKYLTNPFYLYALTNFFVGFFYSLGWSDLLPVLSFELIVFFIFSSSLMVALGYLIDKKKLLDSYESISKTHSSFLVCFLLYCSFCVEFVVNGGEGVNNFV